ncbi:MAG: DNA-binding response regulator [Chloroflexi bacterium]|nr:DNA-binding response regulator [Chloroflexota bacterium]|tara:strand:+ start:21010 stop:21675 length:666 start_codon:yes stop_codon:yes gene_type:complete
MSEILLVSLLKENTESICKTLELGGFQVNVASNSIMVNDILQKSLPDLIVVNFEGIEEHRRDEIIQPIINSNVSTIAIIPEKDLYLMERINGISDFVITPVRSNELMLRISLGVRRSTENDNSDVISLGDLVINQSRYEVTISDIRIMLTFKEYELLRLFASSPGTVFTREQLLSKIWGYDYFGGTRTVDVHIRRLRSKIEDANHTFIETVWNVGYRFLRT